MRLNRLFLVFAVAWASVSQAYPWMIRHSYSSCASCHVDPSGSGQLTAYGRAQAEVLIRFRTEARKEDEELPRWTNFLWFLELPEVINLSGNLRNGVLVRPSSTTAPAVPLLMANDLYATINAGPVVAHVTAGLGIKNVNEIRVAPACDPASTFATATSPATVGPSGLPACGASFVSREYWLGVKLAEEAVMIRGGRINVPFGLRNNEHTSWVRQLTRTDVNINQQLGLTVAYNSERLRGELMGIAGNFQIAPDAYRERGYSAFAELAPVHNATVGLSSLVTVAGFDYRSAAPTIRHAHGLFGRWAPAEKVALLAEADFLAWQSPQSIDRVGFAAMLQGDVEVFQGLHLMALLEGAHTGSGERGPSLGGWVSAAWYALPHLELRLDNVFRRLSSTAGGTFDYSLIFQIHVFL